MSLLTTPRQLPAFQHLYWRHYIATPHRMFFFGGVWALVLSMLWWGLVLWARHHGWAIADNQLLPSSIHGWLMVFGAFPFFIFGFLMTVLPRWLNVAPTSPVLYRPAALCMLAGYLLTFFGAFFSATLVIAGMALTVAAWLVSVLILIQHFYRSSADAKLHPIWTYILLAVGGIGAYMALYGAHTKDWQALLFAPTFGIWAFLAPMVFVVSHRMIPFFSKAALGEHSMYRPKWAPPVVVLLFWCHVALSMNGLSQWLLVSDIPLAAITLWHWYRWQPWTARRVPLLWTLYTAFAWLPIALMLSSAQSLTLLLSGTYILGLAPLHALAIGLVTSMVVAMVTRVSLGHSGRPLRMDRLSIVSFLLLQVAVVARICAEINHPFADRSVLLMIATVFWLVALLPWAVRFSLIYWQPRVDGQPG
ncbi:MAG TPA: NnrS family protein [Gammaproteobacteria bacterium]|nr:NnrS family protein [Gammaproteobacteria bacterium]